MGGYRRSFLKTFSALRPPVFFSPFLSDDPFPAYRDRAAASRGPLTGGRAAAPLREALPAAVHFLVGRLEPGGSARGGGAAGQSPPGAPGISWWAGGCPTRPRLSLQRRLLSPTQAAPRRRDNVAGLVAGSPPSSHLKWVPPGCCLAGRRGETGEPGGGGGQCPAESAARIPSFFPTPGHRVSGLGGLGVWGRFFSPSVFSRLENPWSVSPGLPRMMALAAPRTQELSVFKCVYLIHPLSLLSLPLSSQV